MHSASVFWAANLDTRSTSLVRLVPPCPLPSHFMDTRAPEGMGVVKRATLVADTFINLV